MVLFPDMLVSVRCNGSIPGYACVSQVQWFYSRICLCQLGAMVLFPDMLVCVATIYDTGPSILKLVHAQLNSTEHEICNAQKR